MVLALLSSACGSGSDSPDDPAPASTGRTVPSADPVPSPSGSAATALTGVVGATDENGCTTLTTTEGTRTTWVLVGATDGVEAGGRLTVRGSPAPDLATRCQQGTPFVVEAVEPG